MGFLGYDGRRACLFIQLATNSRKRETKSLAFLDETMYTKSGNNVNLESFLRTIK